MPVDFLLSTLALLLIVWVAAGSPVLPKRGRRHASSTARSIQRG